MNKLFTYILEFRAETYTTQVNSNSLSASIKDWIGKLYDEQEQIEHLGSKTIREIKEELLNKKSDEEPILLKGLKNSWSLTIRTKKGFRTVHIVKTEIE